MADKLTPKQEAFTLAYVETGNASEAYRRAYNAENMSEKVIHNKASGLLKRGDIRVRVEALQKHHQQRHNVTVDSLTDELIEDRELAHKNEQASAAIAATMGKAKLHGLLKDKIEHSGGVELSSSPEWAQLQATILNALTPYQEARQAVVEALAAAVE